ncbi:HET-domain-containing protein [Cladorrhinum samala]|uniref:HET-domain-containing protein n=1 Tax=Cladorrhinum samala TaxID=585594 RepID=A0AAV9I4K9_9PEZI|nr:HET-domain-containing protein [Cladorrhinum samala]
MYTYYTLQEKGWIRILVIEPSADRHSLVRCSLLHRPIEDLEKEGYEALSYCWGTDKEAIRIIDIDGAIFRVRSPLHAALLRLRQATKPRTIWIDAICINQQDDAERNSQVAQMRDVYSRASQVVVWLGEGDRRLKFGMHILELWARPAQEIEDRICFTWRFDNGDNLKNQIYTNWTTLYQGFQRNKFSYYYRLECLLGLLKVEWWTRMWTVQELLLAKQAVVQLGEKTVAWQDFETIAKLWTVQAIHSEETLKDPVVARVWPIMMVPDNLRTLAVRRKGKVPISLSLMVHRTRFRACKDPKDKIFAVLGVVDEPTISKPNYLMSWQDVYTTAMRDILLEWKDLRAYGYFGLSNHRDESDDLPSWVPNFGRSYEFMTRSLCFVEPGSPSDLVSRESCRELYNAGGIGQRISEENEPMFEESGKVMRLKGTQVDVVSNVGEMAPLIGTLRKAIISWRALVPRLEEQYVGGRCQTKKEAFWRTVCLDCKIHSLHNDISIIDNPRDARRRLDSNDKMIPPATAQDEEEVLQALDRQVGLNEASQPGRVFFLTESGYMGLGPMNMKVGDAVAVLIGGETPFIIREGKARNRYRMLEQCYVHGIMDGEALPGREFEDIRIE